MKNTRWFKPAVIHGGLFFLTFITCTLAGVQWLNKDFLELTNFLLGIPYSMLLLLFLVSHEFGHYIAARIHRVDATLPYFLPCPSIYGLLIPFGTLGAVIRVKSTIASRKALFDIGAAGPLAGFVASICFLVIGFRTLPGIEYLQAIHPGYSPSAVPAEGALAFGHSLLFDGLLKFTTPEGVFVPPMSEIYHYPFLCVGWFGLFVTVLNLIPVGQLDGGHITFAMFGVRHRQIGQAAMAGLVIIGMLGLLPLLGMRGSYGWPGWLFWAIVLFFMLRRTNFSRPGPIDPAPLGKGRLVIGWICILVFLLCFAPVPFTQELP